MSQANAPGLRSFVPTDPDSDFPIQNLPWGVFKKAASGKEDRPRIGVAIGSCILDLSALEQEGLLDGPQGLFQAGSLNVLMAQNPGVWSDIRNQCSVFLRHDNPRLRDDKALQQRVLIPQDSVMMLLPATIGDYTDFYSSREHATNVGSMFRDKNHPLLPNWLHLPVGYHGRASSVVVSGTEVRRPSGQILLQDEDAPVFSPCRRLDFELELAFFVGGKGNELGSPVSLREAPSHIFGLVLMNDWSARDIQKWEYQPLGPFVSKSFATTISPWVVPFEALQPFMAWPGEAQNPEPLPYLRHQAGDKPWPVLEMAVDLSPAESGEFETISRTSSRHLYWSMAQQLAHHTITGCNIRPGDLMASGTISGPRPDSLGSLLELTRGGAAPLSLQSGHKRAFLEDGDQVRMRAWASGQGYRIGFGVCEGLVTPSLSAAGPL